MTPDEFTAWMMRCGYKHKAEAARVLGLSRTTVDRYVDGSAAIPKTVALACAALDVQLPAYVRREEKEA